MHHDLLRHAGLEGQFHLAVYRPESKLKRADIDVFALRHRNVNLV
jgi:hypothetical protein